MVPVPACTRWRRSLTVIQHSHLRWSKGGIIYISCLARSRVSIFQSGLAFLCFLYLVEPGNPTDDTQGCLHYIANVLMTSWGWFGWEHSHSKALSQLVSLLFLHLCVPGSMWLLWGAQGFLCSQSCLLWDSLFVLQGREKRWERSLRSVLATCGLLPSEADQGSGSKPACLLWAHQIWRFKAPPNWRGLGSNMTNSLG